jgi:hypothetical protein
VHHFCLSVPDVILNFPTCSAAYLFAIFLLPAARRRQDSVSGLSLAPTGDPPDIQSLNMSQQGQVPANFLPHDSYVGEIYRVNIAFICVNSLIIIIRILVRAFVVGHVAVDDYLMVAAGLCADVFSALAIVGTFGFSNEAIESVSSNRLKASDMDLADTFTTYRKMPSWWKTPRT